MGGFGGGGGGGGDVRPGDWTCPSCGANCFASKSNCFRCNTPKPDPRMMGGGMMGNFGGGAMRTMRTMRMITAG